MTVCKVYAAANVFLSHSRFVSDTSTCFDVCTGRGRWKNPHFPTPIMVTDWVWK